MYTATMSSSPSLLFLIVLCMLRVQCGGSIYASLQPVDPVVQVGSSLTLSCTLQEGNGINQTSRSIIWTKSSTPIPSTRCATPNVSTSLLHLHNVTTADAGKYYCQFVDDEWSGKPGVHVFIGTPPEPVENVTCEAPTLTTFWCKWDNHHHESNLAVRDTLQFRPAGTIPWRSCTQIERNRCEGICEDCHDQVEMRVISDNVLGNTSLKQPFIFNNIVRPKPVREVNITAPQPGCLTITWKQPYGWDGWYEGLVSNLIRHRDLNHPTLSQNWIQVEVTAPDIAYTLCQLRSYATYEVMISTSMIFNFNTDGPMISWSNPVTARTQMTAPSAAPRNLSLNESSENPNWISVTWSPMDHLDENGVILGYLIYSCTLNSSYPQSLVEETVSDSKDHDDWTSLLCIDETMVENITITSEEHLEDLIEYTLINSEAGQSYLVWVSAVNSAGEGPSTDPSMIALPSIPESRGRGRTGVMIVSAITICQVIFIIGLGLCCWQAGLDPFKRNRRLPQPYIPPDVLAMKQEALTPRAPCSGEFFNEPREYKEDRSLLEDPSQLVSTMVSNSGGSSIDHGFYDMQSSSGSNSGSGSSSCSSSQYNSSHYHSASTLRCSMNLTSDKQIVLMKDPETGYSVATSVTNKRDVTLEIENMQPLLTNNGNYDIEEEDEEEYEEDSDGYVNPNNVEPGTVGVSKIILKGNVYDKPTSRHRYQSSQSDTPTVWTSLSDQGFGSAGSDPDSRQVSPTDTTSPSFLEFIPSQLDMLMIADADMKEKSDYFGLDEIESICSSMASSRYRSSNGEDFPYRLPSITSCRRKSKSSSKSSGSESDIFAGYMSMATKEESDNDYGYVANDHGNNPIIRSDEMAFASSREQNKAISTYDMSEFCSDTPSPVNTTTGTELFCTSSSRDIPSGGNRRTSICITIPTPSSSLSGSIGSSPCSSLASSPISTVSEVHEDRQNIIARDLEKEKISSDPLCVSELHTKSSDDHPVEVKCGKKGGYVSHVEATKMSAMQSDKISDTMSKTTRSESCRVTIAENPPKKSSLRSILFTDPVSGYVSNAVFT